MSAKDIYIVYETTNIVNGKYYIGVHKQKSLLFDGYLGSGKILKRSIKKHNKKSFIRETLQYFTKKQDALDFEKLIVNNELINNENCLNIIEGGGYPPTFKGEDHPCYGITLSNEHKKIVSKSQKGKNNNMYGKYHSKETILKMSEIKKGKNSPVSKMWFINGKLFYSSSEAGRFFNIDSSTIRRWCNKFNIPHCYSVNSNRS